VNEDWTAVVPMTLLIEECLNVSNESPIVGEDDMQSEFIGYDFAKGYPIK
jgi:hypothetical protein